MNKCKTHHRNANVGEADENERDKVLHETESEHVPENAIQNFEKRNFKNSVNK